MKIWIDVEDTSGNKVGDGPITSAMGWTSILRLDRAGEFRFPMPATDPRAELLTHRRVVKAKALMGGILQTIGAGVIGRKTVAVDNGAPILQVEGDDLLAQLLDRSVGFLELYDVTTQPPDQINWLDTSASTTFDLPNARDGNAGTSHTVTLENVDYLYVGHEAIFEGATFDLSAFNNNAGTTLTAQYFGDAGWTSLTITDGTKIVTASFAQDGAITWTAPADWQPVVHFDEAIYWVRFKPSGTMDPVTFVDVTVPARGPAASDLAPIIALAPSGWALDTTNWYGSTADGTYAYFAGESVLGALVKVAEQHGEHFRLGQGKEVEWLRDATPASGTRAEALHGADPIAIEANPNLALIAHLEREEDGFGLITRVYPYGAGNGEARVDLSLTTRTAPSGYTLDTANNYIKRDSAETTYGQIDYYTSFKDIVPLVQDAAGREEAANQLFDAALAYLETHSQLQNAYRLTLVKAPADPILPGETVRVVYRKAVDGVLAVDIDATLLVLEATITVSAAGLQTVGLLVSDVARWPLSDEDIMTKDQVQGTLYEAVPQPLEGKLVVNTGAEWTNKRNTGWSVTGGSTDKALNAALPSLADTTNVLATLINSLKELGILGS